jgi:hypothetical protein
MSRTVEVIKEGEGGTEEPRVWLRKPSLHFFLASECCSRVATSERIKKERNGIQTTRSSLADCFYLNDVRGCPSWVESSPASRPRITKYSCSSGEILLPPFHQSVT